MTERLATLDTAVEGFYALPEWDDATDLVRRLHAEGPLHRTSLGFVIVGGHADAVALSKSGVAVRETPPGAEPGSSMDRLTRNFLSLTNPPDHRRLRSLAQQAFAPKAMREMGDQVRRAASRLVAEAARAETFDLVDAVARPLPAEVFMEIFELSGAQRDCVVPLIGDILDGIAAAPTDAEVVRAEEASGDFIEVVRGVVEDRRRHPGSDLLTGLIEATDAGDRLSSDELLGMTCQLFVAGMETTSGVLSGGVLELLRVRAEWTRLCHEPGLVNTAVEECLRVAGPVAALPLRLVLEDVELRHGTVRAGERVTVWLTAANRDPSVFERPWDLDIGRSPNPHLAFSSGIHFCLGASLARLEAAAALEALVETLPDLRLVDGTTEFDSSSIMHRPRRYLVQTS